MCVCVSVSVYVCGERKSERETDKLKNMHESIISLFQNALTNLKFKCDSANEVDFLSSSQ